MGVVCGVSVTIPFCNCFIVSDITFFNMFMQYTECGFVLFSVSFLIST